MSGRGSRPVSNKRSRDEIDDEEITDVSSDENGSNKLGNSGTDEPEELESDEEFATENPADKRRRLAKQYLENLKDEASGNMLLAQQSEKPELSAGLDDYNNFDAGDLDKDIIASRLKQDVAEQQGRIYRFVADKLLISEIKSSFTRVGELNPTCLSCYQPVINKFDLDTPQKNKNKLFAYTVNKDMHLTKYDISDFTKRPKRLKSVKGAKFYAPKSKFESDNISEGHYDEILAVAASPDGKYVVTGGRDRKLIVWSAESLAPVKVIPTRDRRGEILALSFRKNSDQLYAACADYKIRTYSISQFSQLETLYGHSDLVADISSLAMERCVTVGSRDRTAMLWKIPDETRLTFRGGDDPERLLKKWLKTNAKENESGELIYPDKNEAPVFHSEGSIDVVSMLDDTHFVTGSDNGNISLWSVSKKKPLFIEREAHGIMPLPKDLQISGEQNVALRQQQLSDRRLPQPYWITAIYAIPYSNVFVSGSWNGTIKIWKLTENLREFELLGELTGCKGVVTKIQVVERGKHGQETFRILATVAKEHRLGRWVTKVPGARNGIFSAVIEQTSF